MNFTNIRNTQLLHVQEMTDVLLFIDNLIRFYEFDTPDINFHVSFVTTFFFDQHIQILYFPGGKKMLKLYSFLKVCLLKWCASSTFPPFPCLAKRELTKVDTASPQCNLSIYSHKKNTIKSLNFFFFFLKYQVLPRTSNISFRNINCRLTSH